MFCWNVLLGLISFFLLYLEDITGKHKTYRFALLGMNTLVVNLMVGLMSDMKLFSALRFLKVGELKGFPVCEDL